MNWPSPSKKAAAPEFSDIPGGLITPKAAAPSNDFNDESESPIKPLEAPSPMNKKKYGQDNNKLTGFYYERMSKDRTESHILDEIDTATVDVAEDVDDDEKIQQELDKDDMEAFRQELHGAKKQTTRREDGLGTFLFMKTSWSVEFLHFVHYIIFIGLLTQVVLGPPRINRWFMHRAYDDHLVNNEDIANSVPSFKNVNSKAHFFSWMENIFVPQMFPGYVSEGATNYTHNNAYETKLANDMGYRLGAVRLVQLRVEDDGCEISSLFERAITRCNPKFTDGVEEITEVFQGAGWQSEAELGTGDFYSYLTKQRYEGSGYAKTLDITSNTVSELKSQTYVDFATRVLSISFLTYNPPLDLLLRGTMTFEFMGSGDVIPTYTFEIIEEWKWKRVWEGDSVDVYYWWCILCEFGVYLYTLSYIWEEIRECFYWGPTVYFSSMVNIFELFLIFMLSNVILFRYFTISSLGTLEELLPTDDFIQANVVASYSQVVSNLLAASAIIAYVKIFKYLQFHRGIAQFANTMFASTFEVSTFLLIMGIVIISYALAFYMAFGHVVRGYMDFAESLFTLFKSTMGQFTIREISEVNSSGRYLGPFLFVSFIVLNLFIILSMLFAMVNVSFQSLRDEMVKRDEHPENDPMVVDMARILNNFLWVISYIPGVSEKDFTDQAIKRRKKRIARWISGESELLRLAKAKRDRQKAAEEALMSEEEIERRRIEGDSMEVKPLVQNPRKDLLRELVVVEAKQRKMLNAIENLSRVVRAQTFNRINKQMEDLTGDT
ncbi:hypothetical protein TrRE_jg6354 [Triparma retinervis]|uniref:Uncharacterized protein n=1 Tax=Triparma retinervis TaxID=2557542 RepID=A0A9W7L2C4_9STRA|nr:hypothetical protein TrRE_jg6354 [Triparma retinervis]